MRTKLLFKAKKFFLELSGNKTFPSREEIMTKMIPSSFVPLNSKIIFSLYYTNELFEELHSEMLKPFDISSPQMEVLKLLYFSKDSSLNQEDLRKYMFTSKANISSHLTKLEKKKYVKRKEDPKNKRQKLVSLTKTGEEHLFDVVEKVNPHSMSNFLSKEETMNVVESLSKVRESLKKELSKIKKKTK